MDTLGYLTLTARVVVNLASNAASGVHASGDTIAGFEDLIGSAFNDSLTGSAVDNVIDGGAGADVLAGGLGRHMLSHASLAAAVTVDPGAQMVTGGDATGDVISGFENAMGSAFGDALTGNGEDDRLAALGGADSLDGLAGNDTLEGG